nr:hypothetical protein GCM10020093_030120 [Planobispora longispora]
MGLRGALRAQGLRPVSTALDEPVAVAQGIAPDLSYSLLSEGALAVRRGALFVAANGDSTMPTGRGELPGNGAMTRVIATATGVEPIVAGKPEPPLHRESILRTCARRPWWSATGSTPTSRGGQRRGGQPAGPHRGGGPARPPDGGPRHRPTYIAADLSALHRPYSHPHRDGEEWLCGGWSARWTAGEGLALDARGDGARDPVDGLRAACAAAWEGAGDGAADEGAVKAVLESSVLGDLPGRRAR